MIEKCWTLKDESTEEVHESFEREPSHTAMCSEVLC